MTYPPASSSSLTMTALRAIRLLLEKDPAYLDHPECPYNPELKAFLKDLFKPVAAVRQMIRYDDDNIFTEVCDMYDQVRESITNLGAVDAKERSQILKNATDLLTKLVTLREKQSGIRDQARFVKSVIELLEAVLTPAQRTEFLTHMEEYINVS